VVGSVDVIGQPKAEAARRLLEAWLPFPGPHAETEVVRLLEACDLVAEWLTRLISVVTIGKDPRWTARDSRGYPRLAQTCDGRCP
jgi:hypothetical protein